MQEVLREIDPESLSTDELIELIANMWDRRMPGFKAEFEARALRHKITPRYLALYLLRPIGERDPIALYPQETEG